MQINELIDLDCAACGETVDVLAERFEAVEPLLCERCLAQLAVDEGQPRDLPVAA